jgi:hypothetical protein
MHLTQTDICTAFEKLMPELERRLHLNARLYPDHDEAFSEMLAGSWINFAQKAKRGVLLNACALAWIARIRFQAGRVICGFTTADALGEKTAQLGRSRVMLLGELTATKPQWKLAPSEIRRITMALSTSERERPVNRAAIRLDWASLAERLDLRLRQVLEGLVIGDNRTALAKKLKVSASRITQLIRDLKREIVAFFGENLPDCCW